MTWVRRLSMALVIVSVPLFLFTGCQAVASYLIYDLITDGPIFGGDGDGGGNGTGNNPPVIVTVQAIPDTVAIGGSVTLTCLATDADEDPLTYLWEASKGQFSDFTSNVTIWTAPTDFTGIFQIKVTVDDAQGGTVFDFVEVTVTL